MGNAQRSERPEILPKKQGEYTYADYFEWPEDFRAEIVDGVIYEMASPTSTHQEILMELSRQMANFLHGKSCKVYPAPLDVRLFPKDDDADKTVLQPDITVVCDLEKITEKGCVGAPALVVEILSPSNRGHDTLRKYDKYQKAGVPEYWVVDPENKILEVFLLTSGEYRRKGYGPDESVGITVLPGCTISLKDVFAA
jgi:Uma2 family endonuclease